MPFRFLKRFDVFHQKYEFRVVVGFIFSRFVLFVLLLFLLLLVCVCVYVCVSVRACVRCFFKFSSIKVAITEPRLESDFSRFAYSDAAMWPKRSRHPKNATLSYAKCSNQRDPTRGRMWRTLFLSDNIILA